jgi:hypothetical protein
MLDKISISFASCLLFFLSFYLWKIGFQFTDFAILAILPITFFLFKAAWKLSFDPWRAKFDLVVKKKSPLYTVLNGRIRATFIATIFSLSSVGILSWQTLQASQRQLAIMLFFIFASGMVYLFSKDKFEQHFNEPFDNISSVQFTTWVTTIPCFFILWYVAWAFETNSGDLVNADIYQAIDIGLAEIPNQNSILANALSLLFGYEAVKIWAVYQLKEYPIIGGIMCLDSALVSFLLIRSNVMMVHFLHSTKMLKDIR